MKTLLMLKVGILLGIVAPFIPTTNCQRPAPPPRPSGVYQCYDCHASFDKEPNDPCWDNNPPAKKEPCERHRCYTGVYWKEEYHGVKESITRGCTGDIHFYDSAYGPGCHSKKSHTLGENGTSHKVECSCDGDGCNNEPVDQIPEQREGNRDANGGGPGGSGSGGALGVLVGPSFLTLVMGLVLGVGGALLPLLLQ